ncbi:hypothetical protein ACWDNI_35855 [Nocardia niigatensis]
MSDTTAEATETAAEGTTEQQAETIEDVRAALAKYKEIAKTQEKRAKENASAAKELAEIRDAQKTDAERTADRLTAAQAEVDAIPSKVAAALREHLVTLHSIPAEQAELYLTAADPELLLKQVAGLVDMGTRKSNRVPREGRNPKAAEDEMAEFTRQVFGNSDS